MVHIPTCYVYAACDGVTSVDPGVEHMAASADWAWIAVVLSTCAALVSVYYGFGLVYTPTGAGAPRSARWCGCDTGTVVLLLGIGQTLAGVAFLSSLYFNAHDTPAWPSADELGLTVVALLAWWSALPPYLYAMQFFVSNHGHLTGLRNWAGCAAYFVHLLVCLSTVTFHVLGAMVFARGRSDDYRRMATGAWSLSGLGLLMHTHVARPAAAVPDPCRGTLHMAAGLAALSGALLMTYLLLGSLPDDAAGTSYL